MLKDAEKAAAEESYGIAINRFRAARTCDKNLEAHVDSAIARIFIAIKKQRDEAIAARKEAQAQAFRAQVAGLVNNAALLKDIDPSAGAALGKKAFELLPGTGTAGVLHDYLSDTSLVLLKEADRVIGFPVAVNERVHAIIATVSSIPYFGDRMYDVEMNKQVNVAVNNYISDSVKFAYEWDTRLPKIFKSSMTADGESIVGYSYPERDSASRLYLLNPIQKHIKNIGPANFPIQDIVVSEDKNHFVITYSDSSFAVYDTLGTVLASATLPERISLIKISANGRYIACQSKEPNRSGTFQAKETVTIHVFDCFTRQFRPLSLPLSDISDISFSNLTPENLAVCHSRRISIFDGKTGAVLKDWPATEQWFKCRYFCRSDQLACLNTSGSLFILDTSGRKTKELKPGTKNQVLYYKISSNDNLIYLETNANTSLLWEIKNNPELVSTTAIPDKFITLQDVLDSNRILIKRSKLVSGNHEQTICITDRSFNTIRILDSVRSTYETIFRCFYSEKRNILVEEYADSIRVINVNDRKAFAYNLNEIWGPYLQLKEINIAPDFDRIAVSYEAELEVFSLLKKETLPVFRLPNRFSHVAFRKEKLLVATYDEVWLYNIKGIKEKRLIKNDTHIGSIFVSPSGEYIFLTSVTSVFAPDSYNITIYTWNGLPVKTYYTPDNNFRTITCLPGENSFYTIARDSIQERLLPHRLTERMPKLSVRLSLEYGVPGVLKSISGARNINDVLEAIGFYLNRYALEAGSDDLSVLRTLLDTLHTGLGKWTYDRAYLKPRFEMLLSELDETLYRGETLPVISRLGQLYKTYIKQ